MTTSDNDRFLRCWFEVDFRKVGFGYESGDAAKASKKKWFPCNKGGTYRRWYGNNLFLINWEDDGREVCDLRQSFTVRRRERYETFNSTFVHPSRGRACPRPTSAFDIHRQDFCLRQEDRLRFRRKTRYRSPSRYFLPV